MDLKFSYFSVDRKDNMPADVVMQNFSKPMTSFCFSIADQVGDLRRLNKQGCYQVLADVVEAILMIDESHPAVDLKKVANLKALANILFTAFLNNDFIYIEATEPIVH